MKETEPLRHYRPLQESYARQAHVYDRVWQRYSAATLEATLAAVPWGEAARLLDVGCGTGLLEEAAKRRQPEVLMVGVDVTHEMLQQGVSKLAGVGEVHFVQATAEMLPLRAESFDAVVSANAFHHFRHPRRALREIHRVLQPRGWLILTDWCDDYLACKLCDLWLRLVDRAHARTYGLGECTEALTAAGFEVQKAWQYKIDWLWGLMTVLARA